MRLRRASVIAALAVGLLVAGCAWTVPKPLLRGGPQPEQVPLRVGVHYPPELRKYSYRHHITDTAYVLGEPSVRLLNEALGLLFVEVVESPRPGPGVTLRGDLAGAIEARIVSAHYKYPTARSLSWPTQVTYGFTLYSPRGETLASWTVTGSGGEPFNPNLVVDLPLPLAIASAVSTVRRSFEGAMEEAASKVISGFRDVPEIQHWLNEQGVR